MGKASRRKRAARGQVIERSGRRKVSACLIDVIEPFRDDSLDREDYLNLVTFAATAWNFSLLPAEEREPAILRALQRVPLLRRGDTYTILQRLLRRKELLFPDDRRLITSADVVEESDEFRIIVASRVSAEEVRDGRAAPEVA